MSTATAAGHAPAIRNQRPFLTAFTIFFAVLVALCYAAFQCSISSAAGEMRTLLAPPHWLPSDSLPLPEQLNDNHDDSSGGASWGTLLFFVHITDLHLSHLQPERSRRFASFLDRVLPALRPRAVFVSGDLVHANIRSGESRQVEAEWREYRSILESRGLWDPYVWLDVRGNHDALNTWRLSSSLPLSRFHARRASDVTIIGSALVDHSAESDSFANFSVSGAHDRPGSFEVTIEGRRVRALDQTPRTGLHRFFNFFGQLDHGTPSQVDAAIAFGHYPLFMVDPASGLIHDASGALSAARRGWSHLEQSLRRLPNAPRPALSPPPLVYLCGHLHDGLGERLHARHSSGTIELEGVDFKHRSAFRVLALDGGMFSFVDSMSHAIADAGATEFPRESAVEPTHSWPLVLITNPKSSAYLSPLEPWSRIATSTHVRMLIFHPQPDAISSVRVSITHPSSGRVEMPPRFALRGVCDSTWWRQSRGNWPSYTDALAATLCPLFVAPWRPASLSRGALLLHVEIALHNDSRVYRRTHDFSIDGALTAMPVSFRAEDEAGSAMRPSLARACLAIIGRSFLHSDFAAALPLCCLVAWLAVVVPFLLAPFASKYCFNRQDCVSVPSALQPPAPLPARVRRSCGVSQIADAIERGLAACHRCITHAVHAHSRSSALLFAWAVYIVFGPLAWGTFVGDREALMFAWGFYFLDDSHLVALLHSDTLFYLFRRIVFSLLPVCIFLSVSSAIELSEALPGRTARRQLVWLVASRACMALCLFWYLHAELHSARLLVSMYSWRVAAFSPGMLGFSALGGSVMALRLVSLCRTPQTVRV